MSKPKHIFLPLFVVTMLIIQMMSPFSVFAEGETPPETTEETAPLEETQDQTEESIVVAETDETDTTQPTEGEETTENDQQASSTEETASGEEQNADTKETTAGVETAQESNSNPEELSTEDIETPDEVSAEGEAPAGGEDLTVAEVFELAPEGTEIVVVNEEGQIEPLATEEASQIVAVADPIWCPSGVDPIAGVGGCTSSYPNLSALVAGFVPTDHGTIWIENVADTGTDVTIDGTLGTGAWEAARDYNLTLQGGWNLGPTKTSISGVSTFDTYIHITNWNADVTLNDIVVDGAGSSGIKVTTTGNIDLKNITSNNTAGGSNGVELDNCIVDPNSSSQIQCNGTGNINLSGTNTFDNNGFHGLVAISNGDITINDVTASNNNSFGVFGISLKGDVTINDVTASNNLSGVYGGTYNGNLMINNVSATNNDVGVYGGTYNGNLMINNVSATNNEVFGAYFFSEGNITLSGNNNEFNGNGIAGLLITNTSNGTATIENVTADNNGNGNINNLGNVDEYLLAGAIIQTCGRNVNIINSTFNNNKQVGILTNNTNAISLTNVTFSGNPSGGLIQSNLSNIFIDCPDNGKKSVVVYPTLPINQVSASSGTVELNCSEYKGTQLSLPDGSFVYFPCPISDSASLSALAPENLPEGATSLSGFTTTVTKNGTAVDSLPAYATLSFLLPEGVDPASLSILYWNGTEWVEQSGFLSPDGLYYQATVNFSGDFVLVSK